MLTVYIYHKNQPGQNAVHMPGSYGQDRIDMILSELPSNIPNPKHSHFHSMLINLDSTKHRFWHLPPPPFGIYLYLYIPNFLEVYINPWFAICLFCSLHGSPLFQFVCWFVPQQKCFHLIQVRPSISPTCMVTPPEDCRSQRVAMYFWKDWKPVMFNWFESWFDILIWRLLIQY